MFRNRARKGTMPNHSPVGIANEFLTRRASSAWPQQLVLQKLVNAAHGWNLAITGQPLVSEEPEAWDNGPVFRSLWDYIRDFGYEGKHCELKDPFEKKVIKANIDEAEKAVIDHVWRRYGTMNARQLSDMTHEPGTPWYKAYYERGRNAVLDREEIEAHYRALAFAGREDRRN